MMNLYVKDLLNDFESEVKQGHYKKMDYNTWRSLNNQRTSPVEIRISRDTYSSKQYPDEEIILEVCGLEYIFDAWDRSFGEFLKKFMKTELNSKPFATLSAATASANNAIKSSCDALNDFNKTLNSYTCGNCTATSVGSNLYTLPAVEISTNGIKVNGQNLEDIIDEATGKSIKDRKEKNNMNKMFKNFDFGSCANDNVKVSMYGIAVKNVTGSWVSYDKTSDKIIDVDIFNFDAKYLYKMPVAIKDVKVGDTIVHNRKPMFVMSIKDNKIVAVDPVDGEEKVIMLTHSPFGFDFVTKVVNLFDGFTGGASADTPFGNMLPLMLMGEGKTDDMLPLMFMMNGGKMDMSNPMMMYFLMGDKDMLPLMLLMNNNKPAAAGAATV